MMNFGYDGGPQGPYKCSDCGEVVQNAVSLLATVTVTKPDGSKGPASGSYLFCATCAKKRAA